MGWMKDTFKDFTDAGDWFGDESWSDVFDPGGFFDDPLEELAAIKPDPPAKLVDMSRAKAGQDMSARMRLGIGGSRGKSRVVSPFGSGPADRARTGSPVEEMSVATSSDSEIDSISAAAAAAPEQDKWQLYRGGMNTFQIRRPGDEPFAKTAKARSPFSLF